mmetsp:Transcript_30208/g.77559  ORF Transcript_30208/g.77559 Transcript_30208/m.77559 type:complete len:538 (-) Transcript_30208:873-2486(-)|eukprot:jgi/Tetstr1/448608/TSEL_035857.t1
MAGDVEGPAMRSAGSAPKTPSPMLRRLILVAASLHILLASGEAFGWTALRPMLYRTGFFDDYDEVEQASMLNVVSTLGIAANALCKLPLGIFLDRYGPRATSIVGSILLIGGSLAMAWGDKQSVAVQGTAYFCLGASGPFIQMSCFQFSNLFPLMKSSIISFMITLFELSTGVFYLFNVANRSLGAGREALFTLYAGVGIFTLVTAAALWPDAPHEAPGEEGEGEDEEVDVGVGAHVDEGTQSLLASPPAIPPSQLPLIDRPFLWQLATWDFTYLLVFFCMHNFTQGLVMTTMGEQVAHFFPDPETADMLAETFSVVLPMGFLPVLLCTFAGISGFILSRFNLAFVVTSVLSCTYGALFLWPTIPTYVLLFVDFPVARQFVFSTFISYSAEKFGFRTFGTINGLASTIAGLIQLAQTAIVSVCVDPKSAFGWEQLDVLMATVPMVLVLPPIWSWLTAACEPKQLTEEQAALSEVTDALLGPSAPLHMPAPNRHSRDTASAASSLASRDIPHLGSLTVTAATIGSFSSRGHPRLTSPQ